MDSVVGNIAKEPELRFSDSGKAVLNLRVALDIYPKPEEPVFMDVVVFGPLAENAAESLGKGSRIIASGEKKPRTWTGRDGVEHNEEELVANALGAELRFVTAQLTKA